MNVIFIPFAFDEFKNSGVNFHNNRGGGWKCGVYLKNACVALISAKYHNPETEVMFVTNLAELPMEISDLLSKREIKIAFVEFNAFEFPVDYKWSLAFYKLCALNAVCKMDYENICYLDTDVYVQGNLNQCWAECEHNIMMYDLSFGMDLEGLSQFYDEMSAFAGKKCRPTHYGGEFFAASRENARSFCEKCGEIYSEMLQRNFQQRHGDEFIISAAALDFKTKIKNAGLFVHRFWTGSSFRFIASVYKLNKVAVLHVPAEKERGMLRLYDRYISRDKTPAEKAVWRILRLERLSVWELGKYALAGAIKRFRRAT